MDNLHTKDNTYHELAGNVYNTKSSDKETKLKMLMAPYTILKFKLHASIKLMASKQWRCLQKTVKEM